MSSFMGSARAERCGVVCFGIVHTKHEARIIGYVDGLFHAVDKNCSALAGKNLLFGPPVKAMKTELNR